MSELDATCSDFLRRGSPRLCNAHAQSHLFMWSLLQGTKMAMASDNLGSEPRMSFKQNSVKGSDTDLDMDAQIAV